MLFNVSGLIQEGIGAVRQYDVEGELVTEGREPERVFGSVEFLRTKMGVLVRAHLKLEERETCSRCATPLQDALALEFEEEFQQVVDATGRLVDERPDPDAFTIDDRHQLDLTEAVRQYREVRRRSRRCAYRLQGSLRRVRRGPQLRTVAARTLYRCAVGRNRGPAQRPEGKE